MPRRLTDDEFAELMHGCWAGLYRTAYLLVGDHAEAEDLVQTALAKTYASWHRVESLEAAGGYARTTLVNTAASWFRKKGWRNERPTAQLPDNPGPEVDATERPDLMTALAGLPPGQRAVVVLRFYEDRSVAQVAHALGVSEGTVKSQTSQALAKLRTSLGDAVIPQGADHD
ncbi:SigE family RNA polymerase sigma factor [Nocardioides sp. SLBN-35]|uniref:SigE family RNA polymerase sigma factor n=1 Tax=Nocardioides sp. SLBN-35 TaxID=2768445 RepID=UPI001153E049|nr:SigE family RNA polymerase sigma factor [Nocardioides sp. SLBN-35]TQK72220.1 RNA polymerase sigma-70 factor (sigma-E family) [Nocardioides sp. SLBN-35]